MEDLPVCIAIESPQHKVQSAWSRRVGENKEAAEAAEAEGPPMQCASPSQVSYLNMHVVAQLMKSVLLMLGLPKIVSSWEYYCGGYSICLSLTKNSKSESLNQSIL